MTQLREDLERKYKTDDVFVTTVRSRDADGQSGPRRYLTAYRQILDMTSRVEDTVGVLLFLSYACAFPNIMIRIYGLLAVNHDQPFGKSLVFLLLEVCWIILIPCLPPVFVGWTTAEVDKIKVLLLNRIVCTTDTQEKHDAQLFVRYLQLRPFRVRVWRVFSVDAALPLRLISVCTTYLIVMVQLTHFVNRETTAVSSSSPHWAGWKAPGPNTSSRTVSRGGTRLSDESVCEAVIRRRCCGLRSASSKCKFSLEHKVRSKPYSVTMIMDEENGVIVSVDCHDCTASHGGCKHAVAFIMWVRRRREEPSCTSVEFYWKKSRLSKVGATLKFVTSKELSKGVLKSYLPDPSVLSDFLEEEKTRNVKNVQLIKYQPNYTRDVVGLISMHQLCLLYKEEDCEEFLVKAGSSFTKTTLAEIEKLTRDKSQNKLWFELRYGGITASKAHDVTKCKTPDGSLIAQIMGGKLPDTPVTKTWAET
ncbi:hypothetical protein EVAR_101867_1 [Eumeta japonica]|uniref:Gustatory receptor n=1 Tax=Eumeta variegata TaxID=151549 RepID=A0A4C1SNJ0_EUMVA|nr:hypothetical protein EVAR_101867_1 [Eumeta japonica]